MDHEWLMEMMQVHRFPEWMVGVMHTMDDSSIFIPRESNLVLVHPFSHAWMVEHFFGFHCSPISSIVDLVDFSTVFNLLSEAAKIAGL